MRYEYPIKNSKHYHWVLIGSFGCGEIRLRRRPELSSNFNHRLLLVKIKFDYLDFLL